MSPLLQLSWAFALRLLRDRLILFWTLLFPAGLFMIFVYAFVGREQSGAFISSGIVDQLANVAVMSVVANGLFSAGAFIAQDRAAGVIRRFYVSGFSSYQVLTATLLRQGVLTLVSSAVLVAMAVVVNRGRLPISLTGFCLISFLGASAYGGIGLVVAAIARSPEAAGTLANLIYFPSLFLSGAMIPMESLPPVITDVRWILPGFYIRELFYWLNHYHDGTVSPAAGGALLAGFAVIGYAAAAWLFRWE